ncbi:DNA repair protein RadC [Luteitalea pratensis]|jgi:DNA repair protein RadC|uniref:DNA repair protein RadC n=1 Tax=Luteitalea pratensis TaxID=1855912 RepID=A0A143PP56_LUTPR|nr:DNA repair protein RadC [Luteitalea pratensis]AMY10201.1 DNA repair protein RadC [Luteitalea pratensis]
MIGLAPQDRPREKLAEQGKAALGDNELLAVLLGHGAAGITALDLANRLLADLGGLRGLARVSPVELSRRRGVGPATASRLVAAIELGRRSVVRAGPARLQIAAAVDAARYLLPRFGTAEVEQGGVLLLDARHRVLHARVLTRGTADATPMHPRDVFREAALAGAAALVLFHNHPSGDPLPSTEDLQLTKRMIEAGELMGITVVDHVILGDTSYCSLRDLGKLTR